ncbi:LysR family transcriptional regulator [Anthocerotibacter panamensis]|uniref:LysR family transcriptional regulator n=1 Tax=Anthocerotibacter panamensis TaxID=2857077 RepID=UPI001C405501|nr:LysR family transcriptional regulator [Anthocerotibacter panamensis]
MDSKQLQYFLAVHALSNFRLAARQCGISQPGLSKQIMALEDELGGPLFNRSGRQITLTPVGECFLSHARRALRELEQAQDEIGELLRPDRGEVCVAGLHSVNTYLLPQLLALFQQQHPATQLRLTSLGSERVTKVLLDRLVDLAVVMGPVTSSDLVSTPLYEEELVVLVPARHPLARLGIVRLADITPYPQVVFRDGYAMRTALVQYFRQTGQPLQIAVELNTLEAFKEMVRQGVGVALLPLSAVQNLPADLVRVQVVEPRLTRRVELIYRKENYQIPVVAAFARLIAERLPLAFARWVQQESWVETEGPTCLAG